MKQRILLATAAVGLMISGVAIAANTPASTPAATNLNSSTRSSATTPSQTASTTATTTTTTTATAASTAQTQSGQTVLDLAASNPNFSTLASAIKAAGLEQTLSAKGPLTVFAPTNAAFAKLGPAKLNDLMKPENKAQLTQILTYHVVPQVLPSTASSASLTTAEGQPLNLTRAASGYQIQNAKSEGTPISASNGSIIAIDSVLMPEASAKMGMTPSDANAALPSVSGTTTVKTITPTTTSVTTTTTAPIAPTAPAATAPTAPLSAPPAMTK